MKASSAPEVVAMIDSGSTVRGTTGRAGAVPIMRRITLGMMVALLVQYALGMVVNLYVTVPARDQGGGVFTAIGRAFANGPAGLAIHAGLGLLLIVGAIQLVVRSVLARHRPLIWLSSVSLLAILGAAFNGAAFVNSGDDGSSLGMAMLTGIALLCMTISLYVLGSAPGAAQHG
jgi:hypothetical protein